MNEIPAADLATEQVLRAQRRAYCFMHTGWDWATAAHDVTVMNATGERIDRYASSGMPARPRRHVPYRETIHQSLA